MTEVILALLTPIFIIAICAVISCWIAHKAGRGTGWAWGLLGVVGWVIAALNAPPRSPGREGRASRRARQRPYGGAKPVYREDADSGPVEVVDSAPIETHRQRVRRWRSRK